MLIVPILVWERRAFVETVSACATSPTFAIALAVNCVLAYGVNLTQFLVTRCTSALSMHVLGNIKGALATLASVLILQNAVSQQAIVGYGIAVVGSVAYGYQKGAKKFNNGGNFDPKKTRL
jgi:hypothetical protein